MINGVPIILFAPIVAGIIAWVLDVRGVREILGLVGAVIPVAYLIKMYPTVAGGGSVTYGFTLGSFSMNFAVNTMTWYFAIIGAVLGLAMALGMVSTAKSGYNWLFALMSFTAVLGVFTAQDFVSFFLFWELMTFASFMMVLKYNRHASLKYFILSVIGAYSMLLAIALIYARTGALDFATISKMFAHDAQLTGLSTMGYKTTLIFSRTDMILLFTFFLTAFGVKAAAFPLHVWAPDAYSETDPSYTTFFSGALSKAGVYGIFYVLLMMMGAKLYFSLGTFHGHPLFLYILAWIGAVTVVVASFLAVLQEDLRKLLAYSSVGQVGYILLAIGTGTALGFSGALFHVLSHAIFKGLFWLVTAAVILRTGKTKFEDFGGLAEKMPITFAMGLVAVLSLAGIPPMAGFASKWLIYEAAIGAHMPLVAGAIFLGSALAFAYVVRFLYSLWFGQRPSNLDDVKEAPVPLLVGMGILGILNIVFGIAPGLVVEYINKLFGRPVITGNYYKLITPTGTYNALSVTLVLIVGIVIAGLLYVYGANARKVTVTDTYQSGNPVTEDYNLSIRRNFYRPLAEALDFWLKYSWDRFYERLGRLLEDFADVLRKSFYNGNVQSYSWYLAIILLILALWGVL